MLIIEIQAFHWLECSETCKCHLQSEPWTLEACAEEAIMHGSSGKTVKADADILLVLLKCINAEILQFIKGPIMIRGIAVVNINNCRFHAELAASVPVTTFYILLGSDVSRLLTKA